MSFLSSRGCFVSSEWGSASLQEHVNALFPRIQEKKSIVVAKFLIWGFKAHHMLRRGSGALHHNSQHSCKKKKNPCWGKGNHSSREDRGKTFLTHCDACALHGSLGSSEKHVEEEKEEEEEDEVRPEEAVCFILWRNLPASVCRSNTASGR